MKSLKSKVILSAVVLIFALVATIGSTFAWFTVSNTVSVSSITLNVTTADSLLIKAATPLTAPGADATGHYDANAYSTTVTNAQLSTAGYSLSTYRLAPSTVVQPGYLTASAAALSKIDATADRVLTTLSGTDINNASGFVVTLSFWVMAQKDTNLAVKQYAIIGDTDPSVPAVDAQLRDATRLAVRSSAGSWVYGEDVDYSFTFAGTSLAAATIGGGSNPFDALTDAAITTTWTTQAADLSALNGTAGSITTGTVIESLLANVPEVITVTVYIEGWDADASNALIGIPFTVYLEFTIA